MLKTARASREGRFTSRITVPATAKPGEHRVTARGRSSGQATASSIVRTDWATFHFDPAKSGENPYENVLDPSTVGDLEVAWAEPLGGSVVAAPAMADGVIYAASNTPSMTIYALDPADGSVIWDQNPGGSFPSDITVWEGRLYVSTLSHAMYIMDSATGEVLKTVPGPINTPTVVDGVAYATNNSPNGTLWAIDAITGEVLWEAHTPSGAGYGFGLAVAEGMVVTGGDDLFIYAYDASTGEEVWTLETGGDVLATPAVVNGVVYVGSADNTFYAIDADTGEILWETPTGGDILDSAAATDRGVYASSVDDTLYAFDATTGDVLWSAPHNGGGVSQSPAVANGVVYLGSLDDSVYAYNAATGEVLWLYQTGSIAAEVIVVDGTVYLGSFDDNLYAFRLPSESTP